MLLSGPHLIGGDHNRASPIRRSLHGVACSRARENQRRLAVNSPALSAEGRPQTDYRLKLIPSRSSAFFAVNLFPNIRVHTWLKHALAGLPRRSFPISHSSASPHLPAPPSIKNAPPPEGAARQVRIHLLEQSATYAAVAGTSFPAVGVVGAAGVSPSASSAVGRVAGRSTTWRAAR